MTKVVCTTMKHRFSLCLPCAKARVASKPTRPTETGNAHPHSCSRAIELNNPHCCQTTLGQGSRHGWGAAADHWGLKLI